MLPSLILSRAASVRSAQFGGAGIIGVAVMGQQRAVGEQGNARGNAGGALKSGVAACVLAGIEIREAVQVLVIRRAIVEQMRNAEIHAAAAA